MAARTSASCSASSVAVGLTGTSSLSASVSTSPAETGAGLKPGEFALAQPTLPQHDHVVFTTDRQVGVVFNDPRRFGYMKLSAIAEADESLEGIGPEPLSNAFSAAYLETALRGKKTPIKAALLDQRVVAGLGNIYVCEALWRARISPRRAGGRISLAALERLVVAIREVLEQSIRDGGSTLRDYARPDGELGYFSTRFDVYGRTGESCHRKDGGQIVRFEQGGRSTWYCAKCQK